jgi:hypothetical protein
VTVISQLAWTEDGDPGHAEADRSEEIRETSTVLLIVALVSELPLLLTSHTGDKCRFDLSVPERWTEIWSF